MADLVVVVDGGRIAEQGTHDELGVRGGIYADLFALEASAYGQRTHPRRENRSGGACVIDRAAYRREPRAEEGSMTGAVQPRSFASARARLAAAAAALAVAAVVAGGASEPPVVPTDIDATAQAELGATPPLAFVPNRGQADPRVLYETRGAGYGFAFLRDRVMLGLTNGADARHVSLALRFLGASPAAAPHATERMPGTVSYLRGNDASRWQTGLPTYGTIVYRELWPGIDLHLRGQSGALKYEFRVRPGARVGAIRLAYAGAQGLALGRDGTLLVRTAAGTLRDAAPIAYQQVDGKRVRVAARYVLGAAAGRDYTFALGAGYRTDRELVIDPGVDYSTFVGGASHERADGLAVDAAGSAYIVGTTQSSDLPTSAGAFDRSFNGGVVDVFVTKLAADGSLVYSTYLGGTPTPLQRGTGDTIEFGRGIAVDADGHAYVTGQTSSSDFPTTSGAFDTTINASDRNANDAFVAKLNPTGSGLVYSTFLGGTDTDDPDGLAIDASGNAYVTGFTHSTNFPTTAGAVQTTSGGGQDAFVVKLNATGSALAYSTYLGGADNELGTGIAVDAAENAYVAGGTRSADFPSTAGAFDPTHNGGSFENLFDAFATKLDATGRLVYSTFLGGSQIDRATDVAVDGSGSAYVAGSTQSPEFPTTAGAFDSVFDGGEAFVVKVSPDGASLQWSTFTSGGGAAGIALDPDANVWLTGAAGAGAPTTADAFDATHNGSSDTWLARLSSSGTRLDYATFLGGSNADPATDVALDGAGNVYVAGTTYSPDFPTTAGAFDRVFSGDPAIFWGDAFVTRFGFGSGTGETAPPAVVERTTTTFSGELDKNRSTSHTVSVGAAGPVDLALDWQESRANLTLRALDPSGREVFVDRSTAKPKTGTFSATVAGQYVIQVVNGTDRKTRYTLSVTYPVASSTAESAVLSSLALSPTSVSGGGSSTGTVSLTAAAPSGGATITLASSNTAAATVPPSVTIPGGSTSASFTVSTATVAADTSVTISAAYGGVTQTATLTVRAATSASLSSLTLDPPTVAGGTSSTGTVTLTAAAPSGGASVALASSNTATATVPASVTVPAGATSASFTVATSAVSFDSSSAISASYAGIMRSAILSVTAAASTDRVSISRAEYDSGKRQLRVEASSSSSSATLTVHVTATGELVGTLSGGRGEFSWPTNPQRITVESSLGGSATRDVTLK